MTEEQLKKRAEGYAKKIEKELLEDYEPKEYGTTPYFATIPTPHNRQAFIDGYHECQKEHEWHYVKDGNLPDEDVYVYLLFRGQEYPTVARRHLFKEWGRLKWCWDCKWGSGYTIEADNDKIIAWKEIVLPELKEKE